MRLLFCGDLEPVSLLLSSDGRSPNFLTRGLAFPGLAGTLGLTSPIREDLSFKTRLPPNYGGGCLY